MTAFSVSERCVGSDSGSGCFLKYVVFSAAMFLYPFVFILVAVLKPESLHPVIHWASSILLFLTNRN